MEIYKLVLLVVAGVFAGFINTLAGSGSLLTLPVLMFLGLSPNQANATNRVAIFFQNLVAVRNFKKQHLLQPHHEYRLIVPAVIGSVMGALFAVYINAKMLNGIIGGLLLFMCFLILINPGSWVKQQAGQVQKKHSFWQMIIFFLIGIYGGFIQAGVGFFLLSGLVLGVGYDLIKANAVKVLIVLAYTTIALGIFIYSGQVNYLYGLFLAVGNATGAYVASRYAGRIGVSAIRYILLVAVFIAGLKVLGVLDMIVMSLGE